MRIKLITLVMCLLCYTSIYSQSELVTPPTPGLTLISAESTDNGYDIDIMKLLLVDLYNLTSSVDIKPDQLGQMISPNSQNLVLWEAVRDNLSQFITPSISTKYAEMRVDEAKMLLYVDIIIQKIQLQL